MSFNTTNLTYEEQLKQPEWRMCRERILKRDSFKCQNCGKLRSEQLNLTANARIWTLEQLTKKGYKVSFTKDKTYPIEINNLKSRYKIKFVGGKYTGLREDLRFAINWTEPKNVFALKTTVFVCFDKSSLNEDNIYDLNIHHRYYVIGKMAWEYCDEALITLCPNCHKKEHENNSIPVYRINGEKLGFTETCSKCGGSGYIKEYKHIQAGICFECDGRGDTFKEI